MVGAAAPRGRPQVMLRKRVMSGELENAGKRGPGGGE